MDDPPNENDPSFQLAHLHLKKIVKENHSDTIKRLKFCETHPNLLASVGGTQASIYDNENCGEHLDIMMNFVNMDTPALLAVLDACNKALKGPVRSAHTPSSAVSKPTELRITHSSSVLPSLPTPNSTSVELDDLSKVQMNAMRVVVDEGGFDEDIFVGAASMGIFPPAVAKDSDLKAVEGGNTENRPSAEPSLSSLPAASSIDVVQNKRLMQGVGRDIELFDRTDRQLNGCAWVAFPPRKLLSPPQVHALASKLGETSAKRYHGSSDVDFSRIDRTDAWLAVGGEDGLVQLLSVAHCKSLFVLPGHCEPVLSLASGRSSTCLASLSRKHIIIWNLPLIARHHYNSFHYGGAGVEHILDDDTDGTSILLSDPSTPEFIKNLPTEHSRWILQVIPTPNQHLTTLEFTQFGLVAGGLTGHIYRWPFSAQSKSRDRVSADHLEISSSPQDVDDAELGPRQQAGKRPAPGLPPNEKPSITQRRSSIWCKLPTSVISTTCDFFDWPNHGERISAMVRKPSTVESPIAGLAVRTPSGRLIVFSPADSTSSEMISTAPATIGPQKLTPVSILSQYHIRGSIQTTLGFNGRLVMDDVYEDSSSSDSVQGLDISACGRFAVLGDSGGDAHIIELSTGSLVSKLEHKRSKGNISTCTIAHHSKNVLFTSEAILWRWDFISPSFLQKERAEQARAEEEGVDLPPSDPEDDAPDDVI